MYLCTFKLLAPIQPLSILVEQHSQHTICNEVLMKGEYGCLPASLSVLQSAHVIGGRAGGTAASSLSPKNTAYFTAVLLQTTSHPPAPQSDIGIMKTQGYGVRVLGIDTKLVFGRVWEIKGKWAITGRNLMEDSYRLSLMKPLRLTDKTRGN